MSISLPSTSSPSTSPLAAVALGSNLGDCQSTFRAAIAQLEALPDLTLTAQSQWYHTPAVGPPQPDYLNGCLLVQTQRTPLELLNQLHLIEAQFGRVRHQHWGPRTLDLDLLLYDHQVITTPELTVPHPRFHERAFVLVPLSELLPHWRHPLQNKTILELLQTVDCTGVHPL